MCILKKVRHWLRKAFACQHVRMPMGEKCIKCGARLDGSCTGCGKPCVGEFCDECQAMLQAGFYPERIP
jgi:hypothetical protein